MTGTLIFLISVFFEYKIGWISYGGGPENPVEFVRSNWSALQPIWSWQMISGILLLLAYFLFLKNSQGIRSIIWILLIIGSIMSTAAFFLTLGSYGPALDVYDSSPAVFESIRGGISVLYRNILIGPFLMMFIFCLETFGRNGILRRSWGIAALGFFVVVLGIGLATGGSVKVVGLSYFLLPLVLGYGFLITSPSKTA